ncbi:hypothetical protein LNI90_11875 [Tenacibaculum dicentrarchi]|nr:hypothetical protein [Tenacibaculum dicentrarchi]MCD8421262.1 hypothetical protein [Tenacibaculum dicentrarchi]MCD8452775.1 hypothetical protein [Tenacibaculum dicentrarchi]MCG8829095.1 hypothetical protein [Tenacibaculum dicentrarchi]WBX67981.1 hypothetical protein PG910_07555 [Tenacibaculum dicentrarchi]
MKFNKEDIPALNFIVNRILNDQFPLYSHELVKAKYITASNYNEIENEFECLLSIINHYNLGEVTDARNEDHGASIVKNGNTAKFRKDGGFENLFDTLGMEFTNYDAINQSQEKLNSKIEEIIELLTKQGFGQEILFNELQELKELYPKLNKKNWGQVLKGKLIDLGIAQVINQEVAETIFKGLTEQFLRLK